MNTLPEEGVFTLGERTGRLCLTLGGLRMLYHQFYPTKLLIPGLALVALLFASLGCGLAASQPTPIPPLTPMPPPTETATALPTATQTITPSPQPSPTPTATITPSRTPQLTKTAEARAAKTASAMAKRIVDDLEPLGLNIDQGRLGWFQTRQEEIDLYEPKVYYVLSPDQTLTAANFIFSSEITWESSGGLAGCGLVFRVDGDLIRGKQYHLLTIRLSGFPGWDIEYWKDGLWQSTLNGRAMTSKAIDQSQGSTNQIVLLADGGTFTVYANGERLGRVMGPALKEGKLGFIGFQDSGTTTCLFDNSWIWVLP
jgi:hypothetical protein